jgi:hypothetical protein
MNRAKVLRRLLGAASVAAVFLGTQATIASAQPSGDGLGHLRAVTTKYHSLTTARHNGYHRFVDVDGIACIAQPGVGAMGVHYVNSDLVGDPAINPDKPEAMVYAPGPHGAKTLAAVEYIVVKDAWDATHDMAPMLFGHMFMTTDAPNRFGLPAFYSLHVWAYKHNPAGTFEMWNPNVHCPPVA